MPANPVSLLRPVAQTRWSLPSLSALVAASLVLQLLAGAPPADASTLPSASFSGGAATVSVGGTLYAKEGAALTLTVSTQPTTRCVQVSGAHSAQQTGAQSSTWTFTGLMAGEGDGARPVSVVTASNPGCNQNPSTTSASYTLDNTGPDVTAAVTPAANAAGWRNADTTVTWSATDAGSGVATGPTPATDAVTADTAGVTKTATATDRLGNPGNGSVTVKLDKTAPAITGNRSPAANSHGWSNTDVTVSFTCDDATSGVKSCSGAQSVTSEGADQSRTGTATDNADNTAQATVGAINIDRTAPTLAGAPTTDNLGDGGWYTGDVTIAWTAEDALSGVAGNPGDSTITGEGTGLTATASVSDRAGNTTTAQSSPVRIDRTAPVTAITAPQGWSRTDADVTLAATDNLSGVAATHYTVDGGPTQTGTGFTLGEGRHTITYWSVDTAGNAEAPRTAEVKVDQTAPSITHAFTPLANAFGWHRDDVVVTFTCTDDADGSGVASCTEPVTVTDEGADQEVAGAAADHAGNTASDTATVNLDRTPPTITAQRDRAANSHGWYRSPVVVTFACDDALSGIGVAVGGTDCPGAQTVTEGADQSISGSVTDAAGNSAAATASGIDVDETPPTLTGTPSTSDWTNDDVTVAWSCADALSGIDGPCPGSSTVGGEGDDLSASASVADRAGNETHATVDGIRIDRTAPVTTASVDEPLPSGWYAGDVEVTLSALDALSGVAATSYTVNGGAPLAYSGPFTVTSKGVSAIAFWSADGAGNVEDGESAANAITVKIDGIAPTITATRLPEANEHGWSNGPVTVTFSCADAESGIATDPGCPSPVTLDEPGADQSVTRSVTDNAGNSSSATAGDIHIDLEAPRTTASVTPQATADGWHNATVEVALTAEDDLSDVDATHYRVGEHGETQAFDGPFAVPAEGSTTVAYWSVDRAGNVEDEQELTLNVDTTKPTISGTRFPFANDHGWNDSPVTVTFSCADDVSGIATCEPAETVLDAEGAGQSVEGTATDKAGNTETASVADVHIDLTPPTITGSRQPSANEHGWNNTDVVVSFLCDDALSLVDVCDSGTILEEEGAGQSYRGYAKDRAGNVGQHLVDGVRIDKTAPALSGTPTTPPNDAGWYRDDVDVTWTATDELSGVDPAAVPADQAITGEGESLSVTATVPDRAGNTTTADSDPVAIDRTAPNTTVAAPEGWTNEDVTLELEAADNLSGVDATFSTVDGGDEQEGTEVRLAGEGVHAVTFWSVDVAGNSEEPKTVEVRIDRTAPTISASLSPEPNDRGWNRTDVTVTFVCDDEGGSGLKGCTDPVTVMQEGAGQAVDGAAEDHAGNATEHRAFVSLDKTPPAISGAADRDANAHGWYADDVTVAFICSDLLSGIVGCTAPQTLGHGAGQSVTGTATDAADNESGATVGGINVDTVAPTLAGTPDVAGWVNRDVTVAWDCDDDLSGLDGDCPAATTVTAEGGDLSATATIRDLAGNETTTTVGGIQIDRTPPSSGHWVAPAHEDHGGWHADGATAWLEATDSLSGVAATSYRIGDGDPQDYDDGIEITGSGEVTVSYWSVDHAGNVEDERSFTVRIDDTDPTITGSRMPEGNTHGWDNEPVTVSFDCDDAHSGIASCSGPTTLGDEGADQSVTGRAVDGVGRTAEATVSGISIDVTQPTLSGSPTTAANAAGWYRDDVEVAWDAEDGLSGIDESTRPASATITGEGRHLTATAAVSDRAGNSRSVASQSVDIDRTAPAVTGSADRAANTSGWYNAPVTVSFTGTDELSGIAGTSDPVVLDEDGADQSAAGWARDAADNVGEATVAGIHIDTKAPVTTAGVDCTIVNGYCTGDTATITLTATDTLSGVAAIRYRVNGGDEQVAAGDRVEVDADLTGSGGAAVHYAAVDHAGNTEVEQGVALQFDNVAPIVTAEQQPAPNGAGWNNADVTVAFSAEDEVGGSGVDPATVTPDVVVDQETDGRVVRGEAADHAGNLGSTEVTVKLDKTPPSITGSVDRQPNAGGWYDGSVTVSFTCSDALSGVATCPGPVTLTANEANQSVTGTATDVAGNSASATVSGISIDAVKPDLTIGGVANGAIYTLGAVPAASCGASDGLSGLAGPCSANLTGGSANGVGAFTYTATATDEAGNTTTKTATYHVVYRYDGLLPPISDPLNGSRNGPSTFKAGSTVPVKLQLKMADGQVVEANTLPTFLKPQQGSKTTAPVTEPTIIEAGTTGDVFRWDAKDRQYIYNWKTDKAHQDSTWTLGVRLDDGRTHTVEVGIRK